MSARERDKNNCAVCNHPPGSHNMLVHAMKEDLEKQLSDAREEITAIVGAHSKARYYRDKWKGAEARIATLLDERDAARVEGRKAGLLEAAAIADRYKEAHLSLIVSASTTYKLFYEEEAGDFEEMAEVLRAHSENIDRGSQT